MQISVFRAEEIPSDVHRAIDSLCARAYGQDLRAFFETLDQPVHLVGTRDGEVVSHALWITRWLQPNHGPPLRTAYIEAVATDPAWQRQGYAAAVLRALVAELHECQLAALCASEQGQALYADLGWETWRGSLFIRQAASLIPTPGETVMIYRLPKSPTLDLDSSLSADTPLLLPGLSIRSGLLASLARRMYGDAPQQNAVPLAGQEANSDHSV